jgi:hypothetical protein
MVGQLPCLGVCPNDRILTNPLPTAPTEACGNMLFVPSSATVVGTPRDLLSDSLSYAWYSMYAYYDAPVS